MLRLWLLRWLAWDGLLPMSIWASPFLLSWILPNRRAAIELVAVVLPIVAMLVRFHIGRKIIAANCCRPRTKQLQMVSFCVGLILLVLIDAIMILTHIMPQGAIVASPADFAVCVIAYSIYAGCMGFSMYPGRDACILNRAA